MKKTVSLVLLIATAIFIFACAAKPPEETSAEQTKTTPAETEKATEEIPLTDALTEKITEEPTEEPTEAPTEAVTETSGIVKLLTSGAELEYTAKRKAFIEPQTVNGTYFRQLQGGCTDGKYMYFAMNDTKSEGSLSLIYKIPLGKKKPETVSEPLQLDHANDMTYNEKTGQIIVVHNAPNKKKISFLDPETLTVVGTGELPVKIFSMQYCATRDQYVIGIAGGQNFAILDNEFNILKKIEVESTGYTTQGVDADDDYFYFIQYNQNVVVIYDWEGERVAVIKLKISGCEPENIFHADGRFYAGCSASGLAIYELELKEKKN